jgi:Ca2+/Na+ antiporter
MNWSEVNILGAVISGLGIFLLVYGLILLNNPYTIYISIYIIIIGVILLIVFYFNQRSRIKEMNIP